jgi:hypothetical protein
MPLASTTFFKIKSLAAVVVYTVAMFIALPSMTKADIITPFLGAYIGSAKFVEGGKTVHRDMSARIEETDDGFSISWTSATYKPDGRIKEKSYTIEFVPSVRDGIYASAMQTNVFGKQIPLNPLKGEPFVWSRIVDDTLTVFSLFINEAGNYEMQEYHRTLAEGGLDLEFRRFQNGDKVRAVETFLKRE